MNCKFAKNGNPINCHYFGCLEIQNKGCKDLKKTIKEKKDKEDIKK